MIFLGFTPLNWREEFSVANPVSVRGRLAPTEVGLSASGSCSAVSLAVRSIAECRSRERSVSVGSLNVKPSRSAEPQVDGWRSAGSRPDASSARRDSCCRSRQPSNYGGKTRRTSKIHWQKEDQLSPDSRAWSVPTQARRSLSCLSFVGQVSGNLARSAGQSQLTWPGLRTKLVSVLLANLPHSLFPAARGMRLQPSMLPCRLIDETNPCGGGCCPRSAHRSRQPGDSPGH